MGLANFISSILLPKQLVLTFNGKTYQILKSDPGFKDLYDASKSKDLRKLEEALKQYGYIKVAVQQVVEEIKKIAKQENDLEEHEDYEAEEYDDDEPSVPLAVKPPVKDRSNVKTKTFQSLEVSEDGLLVINGVKFDNSLSKKIAQMFFDGYDIKGYYKLIQKIAQNPQQAVQSGLLDFIAANDLPITTDGTFLAYKVTRSDGFDHHSGTVKYEVGKYVEMDRDLVDKSRGVCSGRGLYFASIGYYNHHFGQSSGSARFLVEVDPADVVSIPTSYQHSKGRCCRMKVLRRVDWNEKLPTNTAIIDVKSWESVKPSEENKQKAAVDTNRTIQVTGTQKLIKKVSVEFLAKLKKYIEARHAANVLPTLKNAQKATKQPNVTVSVGQIAEAVAELGYVVEELDEKPFGDSIIKAKKKK